MKLPTRHYSLDLYKYYRLPAVQVSLTLVLSLFVMALFIVFALRPTILSIVTLQTTITESKKTLQQLDTKVSYLQKAAVQLEAIKPILPTLNLNIPNNGAMYSPLTGAVESLSKQSGTALESESLGPTLLFSRILSPFTPNKNQSVIELPFTVRVTGGFPNVLDFLTKILTMERIVSVESIAITKQIGSKTEGEGVALNISGSAYYLADEAQLQQALTDKKGSK